MSLSPTLTSRWPSGAALAAILLVALWAQAHWIGLERDDLVTRTVYEDAFYYFQTARAVARGEGSVSAGNILHNGYHPLWMAICAGFFRLSPDNDVAAIRMILWFGALLGALSAVAIHAISRRMGCGPPASLLAAACFALNPWMLELAAGGLEAPLNGLLLAMTVFQSLRVGGPQARRRPRTLDFVALGVLFGLVYLVRTDNVFFLAADGLFLAWRSRGDRRRGWTELAITVGVALTLAAP